MAKKPQAVAIVQPTNDAPDIAVTREAISNAVAMIGKGEALRETGAADAAFAMADFIRKDGLALFPELSLVTRDFFTYFESPEARKLWNDAAVRHVILGKDSETKAGMFTKSVERAFSLLAFDAYARGKNLPAVDFTARKVACWAWATSAKGFAHVLADKTHPEYASDGAGQMWSFGLSSLSIRLTTRVEKGKAKGQYEYMSLIPSFSRFAEHRALWLGDRKEVRQTRNRKEGIVAAPVTGGKPDAYVEAMASCDTVSPADLAMWRKLCLVAHAKPELRAIALEVFTMSDEAALAEFDRVA